MLFILMIILLILAALFSAAETAFISALPAKIQKLKMDGDKRAIILSKLKEHKERVIGSLLLGFIFLNTACTAIASAVIIHYLGDSVEAIAIATAVMSTIIIIYCEVLPKTYAVRNAEYFALLVAKPCSWFLKLIFPLVYLIQKIVNFTLWVMRAPNHSNIDIEAFEIIKGEIELHHEQGNVFSEDKHMLGAVLDLGKISVDEIMVYRNEMKTISMDGKAKDIAEQIISSPYSRMPIWKGDPENIIGIMHVRDMLTLLKNKDYEEITHSDIESKLKKPWFIPSTTLLKRQLQAFRDTHSHMAIVVNEYGDLEGLVTLEDIVEEVIGQIEDEYDIIPQKIVKNRDGSISVRGDITVRDINREMDWNLSDERAATIGGLMFHIAQRIPEVGEVFSVDRYRLRLLNKMANKIMKVRVYKIHKKPKKNPHSSA